MSHLRKVEIFFVKPLSILFLIAAILYLFKMSWLVGTWMAFSWFVVGAAGASLHPRLTAAQLAHGTLKSASSEVAEGELSREDSFRLARASFNLLAVCGISGLILGRHYGFGWIAAFGIGIAVYLAALGILVFTLISGQLTKRVLNSKGALGLGREIVSIPANILLGVSGDESTLGIRLLLEKWGYSVKTAPSVVALMDELGQSEVDLLIVDICESEFELNIDRLLTLPYRILVIGCDRHLHGNLLPSGFKNFMEKPVEVDAFRQKIGELLP